MNKKKPATISNIYVRKDTAYIPVVARTEAGYYLDVEPVAVVDPKDLPALATAIRATMSRGNPKVPTPTRDNFPKPVILAPAGVKSWNTFEKKGIVFTIVQEENEIILEESGRAGSGGWENAPHLNQVLPLDVSTEEIARRIAARISLRTDLN